MIAVHFMRGLLFHAKRTLKKMRVLDYVVLGGVVVVLCSFLFIRLSRKTQWVSVLVNVQPDQLWWDSNPAPWYAQAITVGQESYDAFGQKTATITNVQSFETSDGRSELVAELNVKASYDVFRRQYEYNYSPLLIGKPIDVSFGTFSFTGMVVGINDRVARIEKVIEARLLAIHDWKISELAKGLQAKDAAGNIVAEILDMHVQNAQVFQLIDTYGRQFVIRSEDSTRKDVIMKIKITAVEYNGALYSVYGTPMKIGSLLSIQFPKTSLDHIEISAVYD